jgi:hypothetical protein
MNLKPSAISIKRKLSTRMNANANFRIIFAAKKANALKLAAES